ncbi:MAG: hypothetical protein SPL42_01135 [Bacteroidales bacterium]|nr:hypothetical protein [Bacteroidales bacterium]
MARTIREIADGMKADFVRSEALRTAFGLTGYDPDGDAAAQAAYYDQNFSAVSVETCLLFVVAACAALVENLFDWFTADVNERVNEDRYGRKGWYEKTAKAFQYKDGNGTDYQLDTDTGEYAVTDEEAQIVRHASAEANNGFGVTLKVAKGETGALSPLDTDELTAFEAYINRLKPAGVPVTVISRNADRLAVKITVYYDPIIFTEATALQKVKETMAAYLKGIDFNGEFVTMAMVDRLQAVPGLDIIEIHEAKAKHEGYPYTEIESNTRYVPVPGYMVLGDDADLEIELKCR